MKLFSMLALATAGAALVAGAALKAQDSPGGGPHEAQISDEGKQIYEQICQACHMADAKGGGGAGASIPALADNKNLADPKFGINILLNGRGGMPWFGDMLTPAQMASVLTYIRGHFNDYKDPVTESEVKALADANQ